MADDDEGDEGAAFDPTFATAGPRRSTFTPPTGSAPVELGSDDVLDDDALADALAADLSRINTGVVPAAPPPFSPPTVEPSAQYPSASQSVGSQQQAPTPEPAAEPADYLPPPPVADTPPSAAPAWAAPAPWTSFPAPDPSQAVQLPDPPDRPVRRSLPDDQLINNLSEVSTGERSATLDMIEKLQAELELREREAKELSDWESNRAQVTSDPPAAEAFPPATVDPAPVEPQQYSPPRPETAPTFVSPQSPVSAWPFPNFTDEPQPVVAEPVATSAPEPSPPPVAPWEQPMPAWAPPLSDSRIADPAIVPDAAAPAAATPPLPAWEVPAPGPNWAPGPDYGVDLEPEPPVAIQHEAAPAPEAPDAETYPAPADTNGPDPLAPELLAAEPLAPEPLAAERPAFTPVRPAWEPQPWDRHDADVAAEAEPEAPTAEPEPVAPTPPPLIEPTLHGPPLLPSQASGRAPIVAPEYGVPPTVPPVGLTPPVGESPVPERAWAAPTGAPLAPAAGDTLDGPTLDAGTVAAAVAAAAASTPPAGGFSFDDLLAEDAPEADEEPQLYRDPEPTTAADAAPEAIFIEPMPVAAGEAVPTDTGSITVIDQAYEEELPDDVDETDRAIPGLGAVSVDTAGIAVVTGAIHPPSGPIATVRVPEDEVVLANGEPVRMKVFSIEESGLEATPIDQRVGRAARLFWLWFASNSSIVSLGLGATIFAVGMSLRQSVVSVLAGVALSFIPLGLTTLAGKRSGQPTMVVSRATFGLLGNVIPAILALVTRVFWGAVLLWLLASSVAIILVGAALDGGMGDRQLLLISLTIAFLVALLVAFAGYPLFARIQLILSVVSAVLVVGLIALTWKYVDFSTALTTPDGPWVLTISGTVLVFSFVGLVWANSGADLARYQRPTTSGAASMLWATVGTTLPTFVLIAYGALLAASDKGIATGFLGSPLDTLSLMLPSWYPVPLLAATGLSLLSGVILTLYSGGFALQAIGLQVRRQWSIVIVAVLLGGVALLLTFGVTGGMNELFRDAATTLAVPTAAWAGIFAAETMIRNRRFESQSLLVRGGIYADVRWLNLLSLIIITVIGYGLTTASITWLSWQGYGFSLLGMPLNSDLAASDVGVLVALVLGLLVPLVAGVPAIRKQEALRPNT